MPATDVLLLLMVPLNILLGWSMGRSRRLEQAADVERLRMLADGSADSLIEPFLDDLRATCPLVTCVHDRHGRCGVIVGGSNAPFPATPPGIRHTGSNLYVSGAPDAVSPDPSGDLVA